MGKRRRRKSAKPTLFDLPLNAGGTSHDQVDTEDHGAKEAPVAPPDTKTAPTEPVEPKDIQAIPSDPEPAPAASQDVGQGPSILFDGDESATEEGSGLDQLELGMGAADSPGVADVDVLPGAPSSRDAAPTTDDKAFLGDRLLGGLADLAAQLIALGLAIAATHALDIVVTLADWMPFGVLALVFSFLYWAVPLAFWGQTPGMAWVGHTARSSNGEPLSFGQTFLRWVGSLMTLAFVGLPLLLALAGRSLTDRISGSHTTAG